MMNKVDKQALRSVAENATTGEWCTDAQHDVIADAGLNANYYIAYCSGPEHRANARYIAAASPATMRALLDENEALAAENERLKQYANEMQAQGVEMFANSLRVKGDDRFFDELADATADVADLFAQKLREGKE